MKKGQFVKKELKIMEVNGKKSKKINFQKSCHKLNNPI